MVERGLHIAEIARIAIGVCIEKVEYGQDEVFCEVNL